MPKAFASSGDLSAKEETLEVLAPGVFALTSEGDPNVGAIEAEDFLVAFDCRATPLTANRWIERLRGHTDKPFRYAVFSHYHAVRTLGAPAFEAETVVAHRATAELIRERGQADFESELARMPRLFEGQETLEGLVTPDVAFADELIIPLGGERGDLHLLHLGRGHTAGDIVAWLPDSRILFAGDLVESAAALYTGDAFHLEWMGQTLDRVAALDAEILVGGRGEVVRDGAVADAIELTRRFLTGLRDEVQSAIESNGTLRDAFEAAHHRLAPEFGAWPIFEHCLPFDVQRIWDELAGARPRVWTAERDQAIWAELQD